jgi:predicted MFS family arabinose efflux permease
LKNIFRAYQNLEPNIKNLLFGLFFLNLINGSFFVLFNYFVLSEGYPDYVAPGFFKWRFLAVFIIAVPLGIFLKGHRLRPIFKIGAFLAPTFTILTILCIHWGELELAKMSIFGLGATFTLCQSTALPYILLNAKREHHSEAISGVFITWSLGVVLIGVISSLSETIIPGFVNEMRLLLGMGLISYGGMYFFWKVGKEENISEKVNPFSKSEGYEWGTILKVVTPTLIIAVGAGFTIPFINLFFENVHGVEYGDFSKMASATYALVVCGVFIVPSVKRRYGYEVAITLIQSLSVLSLFLLATTEWYKELAFALPLAIGFYIIRQPLMNVAGPMTSELTMYYVGKKNQELISYLNAAIWSGSWLFAAIMMEKLREAQVSYSNILLLTVAMYIVGVIWYYFIIKDFRRKVKNKEIEE